MKRILIDTDIFIDFFRSGVGPLPKLLQQQSDKKIEIYMSSLSIFEILSGKTGTKDQKTLIEYFTNLPTIPVDDSVCATAGKIFRSYRPNIAPIDLLIGITALNHHLQIATKNIKHFKLIPGLKFYKLPT